MKRRADPLDGIAVEHRPYHEWVRTQSIILPPMYWMILLGGHGIARGEAQKTTVYVQADPPHTPCPYCNSEE